MGKQVWPNVESLGRRVIRANKWVWLLRWVMWFCEICAMYVVSVFEGRCLILRCVSFVFYVSLVGRRRVL